MRTGRASLVIGEHLVTLDIFCSDAELAFLRVTRAGLGTDAVVQEFRHLRTFHFQVPSGFILPSSMSRLIRLISASSAIRSASAFAASQPLSHLLRRLCCATENGLFRRGV